MSDDMEKLYGRKAVTLAMHMAKDLDTQYPNENRKYSELVIAMIPAAARIIVACNP